MHWTTHLHSLCILSFERVYWHQVCQQGSSETQITSYHALFQGPVLLAVSQAHSWHLLSKEESSTVSCPRRELGSWILQLQQLHTDAIVHILILSLASLPRHSLSTEILLLLYNQASLFGSYRPLFKEPINRQAALFFFPGVAHKKIFPPQQLHRLCFKDGYWICSWHKHTH